MPSRVARARTAARIFARTSRRNIHDVKDGTTCSKNIKIVPYHRVGGSRAYGLLPLWLLIYFHNPKKNVWEHENVKNHSCKEVLSSNEIRKVSMAILQGLTRFFLQFR